MTNTSYHIIRKALIDQRNRVAHSPKEATKLIDDLGIRHILVNDGDGEVPLKPSVAKVVVKEVTPLKQLAVKKAVVKKMTGKTVVVK